MPDQAASTNPRTGSQLAVTLRLAAALCAALIIGLLAAAPSGAAAVQHPLALHHAAAPFGHFSRSLCGSVAPGHAHCLALALTSSSAPSADVVVNTAPEGYGPADLQSAYKLSSLAASGGSTQTVALIDAYDDPSAESDLATYRSTYGLSACSTANGCFRKVNQQGGTSYPAANSDWDGEISLDLDMVSAICPNCHILLVEADDDSMDDLGASVNEAVTLGATQVSNSYSTESEWSTESSYDHYYEHPGVAVVASTGDDGYDNCATGTCTGAGYPAVSPYVTAAGGTSLYSAPTTSRGWTESAWSRAGSGCSLYEPKPLWQLDGDCPGRMEADVSAVADPNTGVAVYSTAYGGWVVFGGTSASSPIIASIDALIGPAATAPGYPYSNASDYFDVTTGSNETATVANGTCSDYQCNAGVGYDGPTGVGTPDGSALPTCPADPALTSNPSNQTVSAPSGASFDAAASDPSGCSTLGVQWQVSSNSGSTWSNDTTDAGNNTDTLNVNPTSTSQSGYEYRALFTDEYGSTSSSAATLTVNPSCEADPTITTNPSNQTVSAPSGASFDAAASDPSGCSTLNIQWQVSTNGGSTWSNDTTDSGNSTETLNVNPTSTSQSGYEYRALFTDERGSTDSSAATLTINPSCEADPTLTTNPSSNQTVTAPSGASFAAAASDPPGCSTLDVQWQVSIDAGSTWSNDTTDSGNGTDTLNVSPTSTSQSGYEYRALFADEHGSTSSSAARLTVNPAPCAANPTVTENPTDQTRSAPAGASFDAAATNGDPDCHALSVQWQVSGDGGSTWSNDTTDSGNSTDTLSVSPTATSQSGYEYRALFSNEHGQSASGDAMLTVKAPAPSAVKPVLIVAPTVSGKLRAKRRLTGTNGSWAGTRPISYTYQWMSCAPKLRNGKAQDCKALRTGTERTLTLAKQDVGRRLELVVSASNAAGRTNAASKPTAVVAG